MSIFTKVSTDVSRDISRIFGNYTYHARINTEAVEQAIKLTIQKPGVQRAIQDKVKTEIVKHQNEVRQEILAGLLGNVTKYEASNNMFDRIKQIRTNQTLEAKKTDQWIRKYHGGDWYSYKGGLARKHLYESGSGRFKGFSVVGRREVRRKNGKLDEVKVAINDQGSTSTNFPKKFKHTLAVEHDSENGGFRDPGFNAAHAKLREQLVEKDVIHAYSRARELLLSKQAVERGKLTLSGGGTSRAFRIPYAKTGTLARDLSRSFSFISTTYKNTNKDLGQFNFTTTYTLATEQLPNDVHDAWRFARPEYHNIVYEGTSAIAIEYIKKVILRTLP